MREAAVGFRAALANEVPAVVALLADDEIGASRESRPGSDADRGYRAAFEAIDTNPNDLLVVGVRANRVVACAQVTLLHHLSHRGGTRAQIEAVRVASDLRGTGVGAALIRWCESWARDHGASQVQLTTDKRRTDAHRFYTRLGYTASHEGFKRGLR